MLVILDVEWMKNCRGTDCITQMTAARCDDELSEIDRFSTLIYPAEKSLEKWDDISHSGHTPAEFKNGLSESNALKDFSSWLDKEDVICVWHHGAVDVLNAAWKVTFGNAFRYKTVCAGRKVRSKMGTNVSERPSMYAIAAALHIEQHTAHCSDHDVSLLRNILIASEIGRTDLEGEPSAAYVPSIQLSRREKNVGIIAGSGHRFVFAHDSAVFHRSDCKLVLNARSIEGCSYYQKAIQKRRPCKICKPHIEDGLDRLPKTSPFNKKAPAYDPNDEVIRTKMLGYVYLDIRRGKIVGCCHSLLHPGKLTLKIMKEHDCLGKNCPRFEKYDDAPYWTELEKKKAGKALSRKIQQKKKEKDRIAAEELEDFKEIFQSFVDDAGYAMEIIRIERLSFRYFRIFYVSEYRFADGNRFPVFFNTTKFFYPEIRIELRHIKDVDGHFVTIDEYHSRKR
ncbi:MAG: exonuclease domain-containing protein [Eubacteriales bacterium]|nr:exonuclease domain-containing protein [Eubacteriales bacterium]